MIDDNRDEFNAELSEDLDDGTKHHSKNLYRGGPDHNVAPDKVNTSNWFEKVSDETAEALKDPNSVASLAKNQTSWFCTIPFNQIYVEIDGQYQACCFGAPSGVHFEDVSLKDWMINSKYMNDLRTEMLDPNSDLKAVERHCKRCRDDERRYGRSRRTNCMKIHTNSHDHWDGVARTAELYRASGGEFDIDERIFELQLKIWGSNCNLDCHMCMHANSTTRINSGFKHDVWQDAIFGKKENQEQYIKNVLKDRVKSTNAIDQCVELAPWTRSIKLIGGEPLIMKKQYEMLDRIIETGHSKEIIIKYQTNLTKMGTGKHRFIDYIPHFKKIHMVASVDGIGPVNDYMRRKSSWEEIEDNIDILQKYDNVYVDFNGLVSFLSVMRFWQVPDYVKANTDKVFAVNWAMLELPVHLRVNNLPQPIKDKLIPIYEEKGWPDIVAALKLPPEPDVNIQDVFQYLLKQDRFYEGTKWEMHLFEVFPELEEYYVPRNTATHEQEIKFALWDKQLEDFTAEDIT